MIQLKNINKSYGERKVLDNYSLNINKEEIVVITGSSGCGKSTLLNIMGLIDDIDSGEVIINDSKIKKIGSEYNSKLIRDNIAYLFQNYALIDNDSIKDNLMVALKYTKHKKNKKEDIINDVCEQVGINNNLNQKIYECSGGEQQRIALARAIIKPSSIILCDEPTGNLDRDNANKIIDLLKLIRDKYHKTIVIVTHDDNVLRIADKHYKISSIK